jgi:hypothetical protein
MENKEKLRNKLKKKREALQNRTTLPDPEEESGEHDILKMMEQVNKVLRTNPQMVQQISKCVTNVMNNKDLMQSLAGQLNVQDQTLESSSLTDKVDA